MGCGGGEWNETPPCPAALHLPFLIKDSSVQRSQGVHTDCKCENHGRDKAGIAKGNGRVSHDQGRVHPESFLGALWRASPHPGPRTLDTTQRRAGWSRVQLVDGGSWELPYSTRVKGVWEPGKLGQVWSEVFISSFIARVVP